MAVLLVQASQLSPTGPLAPRVAHGRAALWDVALSACRRVAGIESEQARLSVVLAVTGRSDERTVRNASGASSLCVTLMDVPGAMELSGLGVSAARYVIGGGAAGVPLKHGSAIRPTRGVEACNPRGSGMIYR